MSGHDHTTSTPARSTRGAARRLARGRLTRCLALVPLLLALLTPASALALAEYGETTPSPTTPAPHLEEPRHEVKGEETAKSPEASPEPEPTPEPAPEAGPEPEAAPAPVCGEGETEVAGESGTECRPSSLPFTGFNLTWVALGGAVLLAGGLSLRLLARRQRL